MRVDAGGVLDNLNTVIDSREVLTTLLVALVTGAFGLLWSGYRRRRRIAWSVLYDEPINQGPVAPSGQNMWEISSQGQEIEHGSLVVLDVRNSGSEAIEETHFAVPLSFGFPGRKVVHFKVRDSDDLHQLIQRSADTLPPGDDSKIVLPPLPLNRRAGFKLLVLLTGTGSEVKSGGIVRSGQIVHHTRHPRRFQVAAALSVVGLVVGVSGGVWLANRALTPAPQCASGTLTIEGSSAFAPIANEVKTSYEQSCPGASITVVANGSGEGLQTLAASKSPSIIAMYDGLPAQGAPAGLLRHPAGVVIFAVVADRSLPAGLFTTGLSSQDVQTVFDDPAGGGYTAVGRTTVSGTRATFDSVVLGGQDELQAQASACPSPGASTGTSTGSSTPPAPTTVCLEPTTMDLLTYVNETPNALGYAEADALPYFPNVGVVPLDGYVPTRQNALSGKYPFVATEYLYTEGTPGGLAADFINFLTSRAMTVQLRDHAYIGCSDLGGSKLDGACS